MLRVGNCVSSCPKLRKVVDRSWEGISKEEVLQELREEKGFFFSFASGDDSCCPNVILFLARFLMVFEELARGSYIFTSVKGMRDSHMWAVTK